MENTNYTKQISLEKKVLMVLLSVALLFFTVYLTVLIRNTWKSYNYVGKAAENINQVSFSGNGKTNVIPDLAVLNIGVKTEANSVKVGQDENTKKMNSIIDLIKKDYKIEDKDITTTRYNINPSYSWVNNIQRIDGYTISQSVSVKIRNFENIGDILALSADKGANIISGPIFSIDDPEEYKSQAREEAISEAKAKAQSLADKVGLKLGNIVGYYEGQDNAIPIYYNEMAKGMGGAADLSPNIESGSQDIEVNVTITYEIL